MRSTMDEGTKAVLKSWREEIRKGKYPRQVVQSAIDDYIFSERTRKMLTRRILDGICFEPLAVEFDMSERQVKTIVRNAELILYSHLP